MRFLSNSIDTERGRFRTGNRGNRDFPRLQISTQFVRVRRLTPSCITFNTDRLVWYIIGGGRWLAIKKVTRTRRWVALSGCASVLTIHLDDRLDYPLHDCCCMERRSNVGFRRYGVQKPIFLLFAGLRISGSLWKLKSQVYSLAADSVRRDDRVQSVQICWKIFLVSRSETLNENEKMANNFSTIFDQLSRGRCLVTGLLYLPTFSLVKPRELREKLEQTEWENGRRVVGRNLWERLIRVNSRN